MGRAKRKRKAAAARKRERQIRRINDRWTGNAIKRGEGLPRYQYAGVDVDGVE